MAQEPLKPFKGSIVPYKKVCVIENGEITRMYWEHPTGNDEFDIEPVLETWRTLGPNEDYTSPRWLSEHGFSAQNVIRDGVRPTS